MCIFTPAHMQYCFIISKARFIISLQQGYILCAVKTGNRSHARHEVTCIPLLHITHQPSAYLNCDCAPAPKEARSDSQSCCSALSVAKRCVLGLFCACVRAAPPGTCQSPWSFLNEVLWEMRVYLIWSLRGSTRSVCPVTHTQRTKVTIPVIPRFRLKTHTHTDISLYFHHCEDFHRHNILISPLRLT